MNTASTAPGTPQPRETELKFALPETDVRLLLQQLRRCPPLARRKPEELALESVYFDTADELLRAQGIALRVRCVDVGGRIQWLQALKTAGAAGAALSVRGEWEAPVAGPALECEALQGTPWEQLDADGKLLQRLQPRFSTRFMRHRWEVRRGGAVVEVALDVGEVVAADDSEPIRELELELKEGPQDALFALAREIAQTVALLPAVASKAQRGQALAEGRSGQACHAEPPELGRHLPLPQLAYRVLGEAFAQFAGNLVTLLGSNQPEVVHQARVGWRRLRSALKLLKPALQGLPPPELDALRELRAALGRLRDLDVAATATLPAWTVAFAAGDPQRLARWSELENALREAADDGRAQARTLLRDPAIGRALLAFVHWLHQLGGEAGAQMPLPEGAQAPRAWLKQRVERLHRKLRAALRERRDAESEHRARIAAKGTRYGIEVVAPLLPEKAQRWAREAAEIQEQIGLARDLTQAAGRLQEFAQGAQAAEFLRGVAAGQNAARRGRR